jgi:hypothetical protein
MSATHDEIVALARVVTDPANGALLIGENNQMLGKIPIEHIAPMQSFAVTPRQDLLACDVDGEDDAVWAQRVMADVQARGGRYVRSTSGRPQHEHIWLRTPPGTRAPSIASSWLLP